MKRSQLLGRTLRESPLVPDLWTELALRAALFRFVDDQVIFLPLGERVIARLMDILGSNHSPAQEVRLQPGFHMSGVNYPRDFSVTFIADIALAKEGNSCPACSEALKAARGIYLGGVATATGIYPVYN